MSWIRLIGIVAAADQDAANATVNQLDATNVGPTFSSPLSPTGHEPATHYACSAVVSQAAAPSFLAFAAPGNAQGRRAWRGVVESDEPGSVVVDVGAQVPTDTSTARFTFDRVLADCGLQRVIPDALRAMLGIA